MGEHMGPSSILHGHQMGPIKIPSTLKGGHYMGPPPDLLDNYMGTKGASQVALNNKMGIAHVVPQDTAYTKLLLLFSLSSNLSINKLLKLLSNIYISLFVQIKCTYNKVEHEVMLVQKSNI